MGILDELLGGGKLRGAFDDFVNRYQQGHPADGYRDDEVVERYSEIAHEAPDEDYLAAAQDALARLSPAERAEFLALLQDRARARGVSLPQQVGTDPKDLGKVVTDLHRKPGQLRDILAGGPSSRGSGGVASQASGPNGLTNVLASPVARAALAGIAAMLVKRVTQR